ncbi:MAG: transmembrane 220 family protein, partial [Verrucomicrobiota bacterium]
VIGLIFFLFAGLQWEDDNPEVYANPSMGDVIKWVTFYALVGVLYFWTAFGKLPRLAIFFVMGFALLLLLQSSSGFWANLSSGEFNMTKEAMNPENAPVEESREFFGVLIAIAALLGLFCPCLRKG